MENNIKPINLANLIELSPIAITSLVVSTIVMVTLAVGAQIYTHSKEVEIEMAISTDGAISDIDNLGEAPVHSNSLGDVPTKTRLLRAL